MTAATKNCPACGEEILAVAKKCRYCHHYLDESMRPPAPRSSTLDRLIMPVDRPASAVAAGYLGLFAFFPIVGLVAGILAVVFGILALKKIGREPSLAGKGRAWFGIIAGAPLSLLNGLMVVVLIIELGTGRAAF